MCYIFNLVNKKTVLDKLLVRCIMPILLFIIWVVFNGNLTLEIAVFGVVISLVVYFFFSRFLGYNIKKEIRLYRFIGCYLGYAFLVLWEILKANRDVIRVIYGKKKPEPVLIRFKSGLETNAARVALANSITLTPGTVTVLQEEDEFTVHCLDKSFSVGIEDSSFVRRLKKIEEKTLK